MEQNIFIHTSRNAPGMVAVDYDNGLKEVVKESDDDFENLYAIHAMHGISKGQTEGTVAWY